MTEWNSQRAGTRSTRKSGSPVARRGRAERRCAPLHLLTAAVAMLLLAGTALGNIVEFAIDESASAFKQTNVIFGPLLGTFPLEPQSAGSDTASLYGRIYVDFQPGSIQLLSGSQIRAAITGNYSPFDPVISNPVGPPGVGTTPGSYGYKNEDLSIEAVQYNLKSDFGYLGGGIFSTPMALVGGTFDLDGQAMQFVTGRQAFVSALANATGSLAGGVVGFFGSDGADLGTWDGLTLTIPMHSTNTFFLSNDLGGINQTTQVVGQIVARPVVPEPSSLALVISCFVSVALWGWRRECFLICRALHSK
jgi:hypothetical protein